MFEVFKAVLILVVAGLLVGCSSAFGADGKVSEPYDRTQWYAPDALTSDDPRRLPVRPVEMSDDVTVFRNARIFSTADGSIPAGEIIIRGNRIEAVNIPQSESPPDGATVIDATGLTALPGLIDLHVHLTYIRDPAAPEIISSESQADAALRGYERAQRYLDAGITTVRDVGSHGMAPFILKSYAQSHRLDLPRIYTAGQVITSHGGHGTEGFFLKTSPPYGDAIVRVASGPDEWRQAVREQFARGADLIKLASHFTEEEVRAAIEEAHSLGLKVIVDSETQFTELAVKAGVDVVEHPLPRSRRAIDLMVKNGVASVPTIVPYQIIIEKSGGYFGSTSRRFTLTEETIMDMTKRLYEAGVPLGVGTDLILNWDEQLPGVYVREMKNFVKIGMSAPEAIIAATRVGAEILGMDDRLGEISPGKLADIILVEGRPEENLEDLMRTKLVMVDGRVMVNKMRAP